MMSVKYQPCLWIQGMKPILITHVYITTFASSSRKFLLGIDNTFMKWDWSNLLLQQEKYFSKLCNLWSTSGTLVRRGSFGSASACCKAGPSSILGSPPQGGVSHWAYKRWGNDERPQRMAMNKCIVWMWLNDVCMLKNMKNSILPLL